MLEYPESYTIAGQMRASIMGKTVTGGEYVNPNANIFHPNGAPERYPLLKDGRVIEIEYHAPDLYVRLDNGYGILFLQGGGKILYNESKSKEPAKYNFRFSFSDGSSLTYSVKLWSYGVDAITHAEWAVRKKRTDSERFQPLNGTLEKYLSYIHTHDVEKQPVKTYLAKNLAGVMSTFAGEILLYAGIHPSITFSKLDDMAHEKIFTAMDDVLTRACAAGGRTSEVDLYQNPGKYQAMTERKHIGEPCPICHQAMGKISVGGIIAYCPSCQKKA